MSDLTRTQDEILARYREVAEADVFGFRRDVLASTMTADALRQAGVTVEDALAAELPMLDTAEKVTFEATEYLKFAIGKIIDHRRISATRSVDKLTEYAWLSGRDDVAKAMGEAEYAQYGAPKVRAFAEGMALPFLEDAPDFGRTALDRMSAGMPCYDGCDQGCDK